MGRMSEFRIFAPFVFLRLIQPFILSRVVAKAQIVFYCFRLVPNLSSRLRSKKRCIKLLPWIVYTEIHLLWTFKNFVDYRVQCTSSAVNLVFVQCISCVTSNYLFSHLCLSNNVFSFIFTLYFSSFLDLLILAISIPVCGDFSGPRKSLGEF